MSGVSSSLTGLLKLPAAERAELALALWESLSEEEREDGLSLTGDEAAGWTSVGTPTFRTPHRPSRGVKCVVL